MKIVFLGMASCFTPGMLYLENCLSEELQHEGHEVVYISNQEFFVDGRLEKGEIGTEYLENGVKLYRIPYKRVLTSTITEKIRLTKGVFNILVHEKPDIIFCQGIQFSAVLDVVRYKKSHYEVCILADNHASYQNSGLSWISLNILHGRYYRYLYKKIEPYLVKYYYVGTEEKRFAVDIYDANDKIMELLPLGGKVLSDKEYEGIRECVRKRIGIKKNELLFVHSGKINHLKKTDNLIRAFTKCNTLNARLIIIGEIEEEYKKEILPLVEKDKRINYIGWVEGKELTSYLCAADMYCQPGGVSVTFQTAVCSRCAILSYPHQTYLDDYNFGNIMWAKDEEDICLALKTIENNPQMIDELKKASLKMALNMLDYRVIAKKVTFPKQRGH